MWYFRGCEDQTYLLPLSPPCGQASGMQQQQTSLGVGTTHQPRKLRFAPRPPPYPPPGLLPLCTILPCPLPAHLPVTPPGSPPTPCADCVPLAGRKEPKFRGGRYRAELVSPPTSKLCGEVMREHWAKCKGGASRAPVVFDPARHTMQKPAPGESDCTPAVVPSSQVHSSGRHVADDTRGPRRTPQYRRFQKFMGSPSTFWVGLVLALFHAPIGLGELRLSPSGCAPGEGVQFSPSGEILCEECPANSWNPAYNETCILCPPGKSSPGTPGPNLNQMLLDHRDTVWLPTWANV